MQLTAMRQYARKRGWEIAVEVKDIGSGASLRQKREELLVLARKRAIDLVVEWEARSLGSVPGRLGQHPPGIVIAQGWFRLPQGSSRLDHSKR